VIGENMKDRVIPKAKEIGAEYYKPRERKASYTLEEKIEKNIRWIKEKISKGYGVRDLGPKGKHAESPFYKAEKEIVKDRIKQGVLKDYKKIE
jgi:hypothetical protein